MESTHAVQVLSALAQESRLAIFRLLVRAQPDGLPAGQIAAELGVSPGTLTFHLKELTSADLIQQRREGRSIIYSLNMQTMQSLLAFLIEDCCQGRPELARSAVQALDCCKTDCSK